MLAKVALLEHGQRVNPLTAVAKLEAVAVLPQLAGAVAFGPALPSIGSLVTNRLQTRTAAIWGVMETPPGFAGSAADVQNAAAALINDVARFGNCQVLDFACGYVPVGTFDAGARLELETIFGAGVAARGFMLFHLGTSKRWDKSESSKPSVGVDRSWLPGAVRHLRPEHVDPRCPTGRRCLRDEGHC